MGYRDREPPKDVIRRLREIDATAELVWRHDRWLLGVWRFSEEAASRASVDIARLMRRKDSPEKWHTIRFLRDVQRGFRRIAEYETDDFGRIVAHFRLADYLYRRDRDRAAEEAFDAAELHADTAQKYIQDFVRQEGAGLARRSRGRYARQGTIRKTWD